MPKFYLQPRLSARCHLVAGAIELSPVVLEESADGRQALPQKPADSAGPRQAARRIGKKKKGNRGRRTRICRFEERLLEARKRLSVPSALVRPLCGSLTPSA
jgi:hypothetical protein